MCVCVYLLQLCVWFKYSSLEQSGSAFDFVATPLGHAVELGSRTLQYRLELHVRQMTLRNTKKKLSVPAAHTYIHTLPHTHLQVAAIDVGGQPIVGDQQQVVRIDFGRLVHQHRVRHVRQTAPNVAGLRQMVRHVHPRVRAGRGQLGGHQRLAVALRDRVHRSCRMKCLRYSCAEGNATV